MSEENKLGTGINAKKQLRDGTIDEALLDDELRKKIALISELEERISKIEKGLGDIDNFDPVSVYNQAKQAAKGS